MLQNSTKNIIINLGLIGSSLMGLVSGQRERTPPPPTPPPPAPPPPEASPSLKASSSIESKSAEATGTLIASSSAALSSLPASKTVDASSAIESKSAEPFQTGDASSSIKQSSAPAFETPDPSSSSDSPDASETHEAHSSSMDYTSFAAHPTSGPSIDSKSPEAPKTLDQSPASSSPAASPSQHSGSTFTTFKMSFPPLQSATVDPSTFRASIESSSKASEIAPPSSTMSRIPLPSKSLSSIHASPTTSLPPSLLPSARPQPPIENGNNSAGLSAAVLAGVIFGVVGVILIVVASVYLCNRLLPKQSESLSVSGKNEHGNNKKENKGNIIPMTRNPLFGKKPAPALDQKQVKKLINSTKPWSKSTYATGPNQDANANEWNAYGDATGPVRNVKDSSWDETYETGGNQESGPIYSTVIDDFVIPMEDNVESAGMVEKPINSSYVYATNALGFPTLGEAMIGRDLPVAASGKGKFPTSKTPAKKEQAHEYEYEEPGNFTPC